MPDSKPIQLDVGYAYQRAALQAVRATLSASHGIAFAEAFVGDHKQDILRAARTRLCGLSECAVNTEAIRLGETDIDM